MKTPSEERGQELAAVGYWSFLATTVGLAWVIFFIFSGKFVYQATGTGGSQLIFMLAYTVAWTFGGGIFVAVKVAKPVYEKLDGSVTNAAVPLGIACLYGAHLLPATVVALGLAIAGLHWFLPVALVIAAIVTAVSLIYGDV